MRTLVTGNQGKIGSVVQRELETRGHAVVGFDLKGGADLLDLEALRAAARECDAVVHLAAEASDNAPPERVMATNLLGTWHVLLAARAAGVRRVVVFSSVNALGVFAGHRAPDYLPIDDDHPSYARKPYGLSKRLGEELCRAFSEETGISTVCLRPPAVYAPFDYDRIRAARAAAADAEWTPFWEYGAFLDVRDAAHAAARAVECDVAGHVTALLCADDIASARPTRELVEFLLPSVEWRGGPEYEADPYRALVDTTRARKLLGWRPRHRWPR